MQATPAITKTKLVASKVYQYSSTTDIKTITYLWPCTCHPELLSNLFSILVLRLSERVPSESSCSKRRYCTHNHLVTSHITVMCIATSGTLAESCTGHIPSCGHQIKQSAPLFIEEDILQQCPDCMK